MGNCLGSVFRRSHVRRQIVLILIGLDNAGKTKTVNNLAGQNDPNVLPTIGFKAVNLVHKDTPVTIYDLGGGSNFRPIWSQYYSEVHGVIFVIDSSDFSRLDECKEVLEEVLSHDKISGKPILVLANKQDKEGALDDIDVVEKLNIEPLVNKYRCPTLVESYSASLKPKSKKQQLDPGLKKGYQWLLNYIIRRYDDINLRVQTDIHLDLERRMVMSRQIQTQPMRDIASRTGFENPNYDSFTQTSTKENGSNAGVIVVKPVRRASNSVDMTETDDSEVTSGGLKPKLSPLFGKSSISSVESAKIELEPRKELRKLSPIPIRNKSNVEQHIDFLKRPQSSSSEKHENSINKSSLDKESKSIIENAEVMFIAHGWGLSKPTVVDDELANEQREIFFAERSQHGVKAAVGSDILPGPARIPRPSRPASASQLLRRQLEVTPTHRRRLSLRYMHRAKTSPERLSIFHFEPSKLPRKQLDKGDFAHVLNYLNTNQNVSM